MTFHLDNQEGKGDSQRRKKSEPENNSNNEKGKKKGVNQLI